MGGGRSEDQLMARFAVGDEVRTPGGDRVYVIHKLTKCGGYKLRDKATGKKVPFTWYDEELEPAGWWGIDLSGSVDASAWYEAPRESAAKPTPFNVGDRVEYARRDTHFVGCEVAARYRDSGRIVAVGDESVVVRVDRNGARVTTLATDWRPEEHGPEAEEAKLAPPTAAAVRQFAAGARIRVANNNSERVDQTGKFGTVVGQNGTGVTVNIDGEYTMLFDVDEIEPRTFKPGDWVRDAHDGQVGVVFYDTGEPEDASPYRVGHPDTGEYFDYSAADLLPN